MLLRFFLVKSIFEIKTFLLISLFILNSAQILDLDSNNNSKRAFVKSFVRKLQKVIQA